MRFAGPADLAPLVSTLPGPHGFQCLLVTRQNKHGIVCRNCAKCCARTSWDAWRCDNEAGCNFMYQVPRAILSISEIVASQETFDGHAVPADQFSESMVAEEDTHGFYRIRKYTISGLLGIQFTHFHSSGPINQAPGGPADLVVALQEDIGLQRHRMTISRSERLITFATQSAKCFSRLHPHQPLFQELCKSSH